MALLNSKKQPGMISRFEVRIHDEPVDPEEYWE
jgi:hypothetical protein